VEVKISSGIVIDTAASLSKLISLVLEAATIPQEPIDCFLDHLFGVPARAERKSLKLLFLLGSEMYFHARQCSPKRLDKALYTEHTRKHYPSC